MVHDCLLFDVRCEVCIYLTLGYVRWEYLQFELNSLVCNEETVNLKPGLIIPYGLELTSLMHITVLSMLFFAFGYLLAHLVSVVTCDSVSKYFFNHLIIRNCQLQTVSIVQCFT